MGGGRGNLRSRPPFAPGNEVARRHGAQAQAWRLAPRTAELADSIRPLVAGYKEADEVVLRLLALTLCRLELAEEWLAGQGTIFAPGRKGDVFAVVKLMQSWESAALRLCRELGLTPSARSSMGFADARPTALEEYLAANYPAEDGEHAS